MKITLACAALLATGVSLAHGQTSLLDSLTLGKPASEASHHLSATNSDIIVGGLGNSARRLLVNTPTNWAGGSIAFDLSVDPTKQNYFTIRLWGSETNDNRLVLFCEGKQVGYHHLGDIDLLDLGSETGQPAFNDRFFYNTSPLPISLTKGKTKLHFEVRSIGHIFVYGGSFDQYQHPMSTPSRGIYAVYTHTDGFFAPPNQEKQGKKPTATIRTSPGTEILETVKQRVSHTVDGLLAKRTPLNQMEAFMLARAYNLRWTRAYHTNEVLDRILAAGDDLFRRYRANPKLVMWEPSTWNPDWFGFGPWGQVITRLAPDFGSRLDVTIPDGAGHVLPRRQAYSEMLQASRDAHRKQRRWYTNQSMIVDLYIYTCNRGIRVIDPANARPEPEMLRYLYESMGIQPWLGSDGNDGKPTRMLGDAYYQTTQKGLTRELGYVGNYGEMLDWATMIYDATRPNPRALGDPKIKTQLLKMMQARSHFRYPTVDKEGFKAMRLETSVGWRDPVFPGDVLYSERFSWDGTPLQLPTSSQDPYSVGYAKQMLADGQFFAELNEHLRYTGVRVDTALLDIPDQYQQLIKLPTSKEKLPMSLGDHAWADEEDGVVAIRHGDEILYASLYWRARHAINFLGRVHYITPTIDRVAVVHEDIQFKPSGLTWTRPDEIDSLAQGTPKHDYGDIHSAHAGEVLPIPQIPPGTSYKPGSESVYAGRGAFYTLRYGPYLIAMNMSSDETFNVTIPSTRRVVRELISGKTQSGKAASQKIGPKSTAVFYLPDLAN